MNHRGKKLTFLVKVAVAVLLIACFSVGTAAVLGFLGLFGAETAGWLAFSLLAFFFLIMPLEFIRTGRAFIASRVGISDEDTYRERKPVRFWLIVASWQVLFLIFAVGIVMTLTA